MSTALVSTRHLSRIFVSEAETVHAVSGVDMAASAGEFVCLFGHSGSGKTTLLNLLAGIDLPSTGSVTVDGADIASLGEAGRVRLRREAIGMVHQSDFLIEEFTAAENIMLPLEARGLTTREAMPEALRHLERVGLEGHGHRMPRQLSGGQRQRVGIARALAGGKQILLADEPTGSLDTKNSVAIFELLRSLCEDAGTLVIVASHDPACQKFATRLVEMSDGRIEADGPPC